MQTRQVSRRQVLRASAGLAAGAAVSGLLRSAPIGAQMPQPQALNDDRITFVTTTESSTWQTYPVFKAGFGWDILNLNLNPAQTRPGSRPIEGFGACFNELGWTSLSALAEQGIGVQWAGKNALPALARMYPSPAIVQ